jgi:hypothetical protein
MTTRILPCLAALFALSGGALAADPSDKEIQQAIKAGRDYLHACYKPGGPGVGGFGTGGVPGAQVLPAILGAATQSGSAALAGLALLEAGAKANDAAVANITRQCRDAAFSASGTYEVSLLIMFLDRLGDKNDTPLIQLLTLRLMSGQLSDGSWSYTCDGLRFDAVAAQQVRAALRENRLVGDAKLPPPEPKKGASRREDLDDPKPKKKDPPPAPKEERPSESKPEEPIGLHPVLRKFLPDVGRGTAPAFGMPGDHSNTQFATVGLWCGRRHHVDVTQALGRIDQHYRSIQSGNGGWGYTAVQHDPTPAMTCAGLMGLALGFGAKNLPDGATKPPRVADPDALNRDPKVTAALKLLGDFIVTAGDSRDPRPGFNLDSLSRNLYFMWSLERVGMVYGLTTIGKVNWYDWGSAILVRTQNRDGSWASDGFASGSVDSATAFALLFLCRANLTEDLTNTLRGKVNDPGTSRLVRSKEAEEMIKRGNSSGSGSSRKDPGAAAPTPPAPPTPPLPGGDNRPPRRTDAPPKRTDNPKGNAATPRTDTTGPKTVQTPPMDEKDPLAAALLAAKADERAALIAKYRDTRGIQYTDALARAAARLTGEAQSQVREALAERLTRMTPFTLVGQMEYPDKELRRAAALAAGSKGKDKLADLAPTLIKLINDEEAMVVQAARAALKALTEQDFGPEAGADREKAQAAWAKWWEENKK